MLLKRTLEFIFPVAAFIAAACLIAFEPSRLVAQQKSLTESAESEIQFSNADVEFFENKVRPLLVEHCLECHGTTPEKLRGGLRLTSRAEMIAGGDSGAAIVPGKPAESLLVESIHYDSFEMPPRGKLSDSQIEILEKWIKMGAPDPRKASASANSFQIDIQKGKSFWSFQPIARVQPKTKAQSQNWPISNIDQFIFESLAEHKLSPVADADRVTLLRRTYLALIGLPPTADEIERFVNSENSLDADLAKVVDTLLASEHYGERWGRHWLDVARFAESSGGGRSLMFPYAWRFRDYVIEAYNKDKAFDQFVKEQIAGDLLPFDSHDQRLEQIVATGFLALGPTNYEQQDKELLTMEVIDEQVDTVGRAFLAMTLGCARCHDHKFDPIPMADYYAMAGIFKNTQSLVDGNVSSYVERSLATAEEQKRQNEFKVNVAKLTSKLKKSKTHLKSLETEQTRFPGQIKRVDPKQLAGIVIDNKQAELTGQWTKSQYVASFVGQEYIHDDGQPKGKNAAVFAPELPMGGQYEVRLAYSAGGNRASNTPVTIIHQDGIEKRIINQSQRPPIDGLFVSLGVYRFEANNVASVSISNDGTDGVVVADAVQFILQTKQIAKNKGLSTENPATNLVLADDNDDGQASNSQVSVELLQARKVVEDIDRELRKLKKQSPPPSGKAMSVKEKATIQDGHIHIRGSVRNLGEVVPRGFLQVACRQTPPVIPAADSGRLQLAQWIANPDHPLTSRVYVNRVWRHLFGRGLVSTADNFGKMGQTPSHPELLDYLARRFTDEGWSTKKLVREIVLSRVFRLSSNPDALAMAADPENRLLWRATRRRVDAEVLRDSILAISGELDLSPGGLTIRKIVQYDLNYEFNTSRRSVYVPRFRNTILDLFEVFDIANPNLVVGHRNTSSLPTQALYLLNSPWVIDQSQLAAQRFLADVRSSSLEDKLELAYLRTLGRRPTKEETRLSQQHIESFGNDETKAWTSLFHSLFASLDFRYVN